MLKKAIAIVTTAAVVIAGINFIPKQAQAAVTSAQGSGSWKLVWNDEFNQDVGGAPDTSIWSYDTGATGWGNAELQNYTNSTNNVYIADMTGDSGSSDGRSLAIKAIREGGQFTSGRIHTQNKQYIKYGKIEAKLKVEKGSQSGVWPAFWMLGENYDPSSGNFNGANGNSPWPSCGEIDIMEHRNTESNVIGTLHWNPVTTGYGHTYQGSETTGQFGAIGTIEQWHRYSVEWYEDVMKWYVDDTCYQTMNISNAEMDEFQREHFILLNLALGSANSPFTVGQTVSDSFTDATMYVDYVRVYQGDDGSFSINKKAVSETQPESTTEWDGYTKAAVDSKTNLGAWGYYFGNYAGASGSYKGGTQLNDFSLRVESNNYADWGVQMFTKSIAVTSGKTYRYTIKLNSDVAGASVTLKDEIGGNDLSTQTLVSGENVFTGTVTPSADTIEFMYNLAKVVPQTTLTVTDFSLTEESGGEVPPTTTAPTGGGEIGDGDYSSLTFIETNLVSDKKLAIAGLEGNDDINYCLDQGDNFYCATKGVKAIPPFQSVTYNGTTDNNPGTGANFWVPIASLKNNAYNLITVVDKNHTEWHYVIRYGTPSSGEPETPTETPKDPSDITTHKDVNLEGFQISTTVGGIRTIGSVEPEIDGKTVNKWGFVYGLSNVGGKDTGITDKDLYVNQESNPYIQSYESTDIGTIEAQMGDSDTATYFCRTMTFGGSNATAFSAEYKVRAYALLDDNTYVYSDVADYSTYEVASYLYDRKLMNTLDAHNYLYDKILSKVKSDYGKVDYNWNNSIVKPEEAEQ